MNLRVWDWCLTALYGKYVAYAVLWGGESLARGKEFQRWVLSNPVNPRYSRADWLDLWYGVPKDVIDRETA